MTTTASVARHHDEVARGERFEFGANWANFLKTLDNVRIQRAVESLQHMLNVQTLEGKTFIDIGSGSGLFSLAARKLGARVTSFDYDPKSVGCTAELKRRYFPDDPDWQVLEGSVLDPDFLRRFGTFDVVYSWGVLHHTGNMWTALANVEPLVAPHGQLFIALYNDQGPTSRRWTKVKKLYNGAPRLLRPLVALMVYGPLEVRDFLIHVLARKPHVYLSYIVNYKQQARGMSWWYDKIDWIGGYPFEVAKPEQVFEFYRAHGFGLRKMKTCGGGMGCNEFVFEREAASEVRPQPALGGA